MQIEPTFWGCNYESSLCRRHKVYLDSGRLIVSDDCHWLISREVRAVTGWSTSTKIRLAYDAMRIPIWQRWSEVGLNVHFDSLNMRDCWKKQDLIVGLSHLGDCWDNTVAESSFGSLKQEQCQWQSFQMRYATQQKIPQYITAFIMAIDCFHTWATEILTNMKQRQQKFWCFLKKFSCTAK